MLTNTRGKQYFILVVSDQDKSRLSLPSAYDLAVYRLGNRKWGLNTRTRSRKAMKSGDSVVIYAAGKRANGMAFVGDALISTEARPINKLDGKRINSRYESNEMEPCTFAIDLSDFNIFKIPLPIKSVYRNLSWVRNPDSPRWGAGLMGGALRITEQDFKLIISTAAAE